MASYYYSKKTGKEIDDILDGVVPIEINPNIETNNVCNAIRVGDIVYKIIAEKSDDILYKYYFTIPYRNISLEGTIITNIADLNTSGVKPSILFANNKEYISFNIGGSIILEAIRDTANFQTILYYINNVGNIAKLYISDAVSFTIITKEKY